MREAERKSMKRRAARILDDYGIHTGTVMLGDEIEAHDFNRSGKTLRLDWDGNDYGERRTPEHWIGKSPKRRRFLMMR